MQLHLPTSTWYPSITWLRISRQQMLAGVGTHRFNETAQMLIKGRSKSPTWLKASYKLWFHHNAISRNDPEEAPAGPVIYTHTKQTPLQSQFPRKWFHSNTALINMMTLFNASSLKDFQQKDAVDSYSKWFCIVITQRGTEHLSVLHSLSLGSKYEGMESASGGCQPRDAVDITWRSFIKLDISDGLNPLCE